MTASSEPGLLASILEKDWLATTSLLNTLKSNYDVSRPPQPHPVTSTLHPVNRVTLLGAAVEKNAPLVLLESLLSFPGVKLKEYVNTPNIHGQTPLMDAVLWGRPLEVVQLLIRSGAEVDAANLVGATALHYAAQERVKPEVFRALITAGGNVNRVANNGATPLLIACAVCADSSIVELLLRSGAKKTVVHLRTGENALQISRAVLHLGRGNRENVLKSIELLEGAKA